jgi:ubiquinone/menaquinone biosynthesis C-methylase UbiE
MQRNESSYCDYNEAFKVYDQLRQPNAVEEILQIFKQHEIALNQQRILEGGFGTGAYIDSIKHHVKEIYGVEGSEEGYGQALEKMSGAPNVYLQIGNILNLPFPDDYFQGYMVNQVLHHLDIDPSFPNLNIFLNEAKRALQPGGTLIINTNSQEQLDPHSGVYWNYKYIKTAALAIQKRYIPLEGLVSRLDSLGFTNIKKSIPSRRIYHDRYYEDPSIALETNFKNSDSVYSFLSEKAIEDSNASLRVAIEDDSIYEEMNRSSLLAEKMGEVVIISACKAD